jgi:GntR family transcriptional regulator of vanillate catabolism
MGNPGQHVLVTLRKMIASGELVPGERLGEVATAQLLGVSRTPVRMAFRELEQEGLLTRFGARGHTVRAFTTAEINGAVEVRGVLEGLAARLAGEKGLSADLCQGLQTCLAVGDALMEKGFLTAEDVSVYHEMNMQFHELIVTASGNPAIAEALARNNHLPFASVGALAIDPNQMGREYQRLNFAHRQHHSVVKALRSGQGARAEALMREHAYAVLNYVDLFNSTDQTNTQVSIIRSK